jgi:hypothetical protein
VVLKAFEKFVEEEALALLVEIDELFDFSLEDYYSPAKNLYHFCQIKPTHHTRKIVSKYHSCMDFLTFMKNHTSKRDTSAYFTLVEVHKV